MHLAISAHTFHDWCHLCGVRSHGTVDVWYPENAEHPNGYSRYLRICVPCATRIAAVPPVERL